MCCSLRLRPLRPDLKRVPPLGMRVKHLICDKLFSFLHSAEVVTVEDLVTPARDWVTFFKYPQLGYEGPEAVDGIDLCCPDVRTPYGGHFAFTHHYVLTWSCRAAGLDRRKASCPT